MALGRGGGGMLTRCDRPGAEPAKVHSTHQKSAGLGFGEWRKRWGVKEEHFKSHGAACAFQVAQQRSRKRRHVIWGTAALGFIPKMIGVLRIPRTRVAQLATLFQLARIV